MRLHLLGTAVLLAVLAGPADAQFFNAVHSRDGRDVVAVGDSGQVYRSLNGGESWFRSDVGARPLRDVAARGFTIVIVGDSGKVWRSTDSGGSWGLTVLPGIPDLHALSWPSPDTLFAAGAGGALFRSVNGGQSWSSLASGTSQRLRAIRFRGPLEGWAAGDGGTVITTTDGGQGWSPVAVPTTRRLDGVDFLGAQVWVVGERGVALQSVNGGGSWTPRDLRLDAGADVRVAWIASADTVYLAGGGGFVRRSTDGGATWTFLQHTMQGELTDLFFGGGGGWIVSRGTRLIPRTSNAGDTWSVPAGTQQRKSWPKLFDATGTIRGATLTLNPLDQKTLYMMMGPTLYRSRDDAVTWTVVGTVPTATKANAFLISPKDTNVMLAAVGTPDRVVRSTNGGSTWVTVTTANFGEYGIPLEMHPDHPDTVYFGPEGVPLQWSADFGQNWAALGATAFVSPCDLVAVADNDSGVLLVGDGITNSSTPGKIFRSNDGGLSWNATFAPATGASEVPTMASSRLRSSTAFASAWSSGAFKRSQDGGLNWSVVLPVGQTWGNDVAKDDPNVVVMGSYGLGAGYLSFDGGASWVTVPGLSGSNYSVFARDRAFVLCEQSLGIYRLAVNDSFPLAMGQTLALASPDGGEDWNAGSVHPITWNAAQVALAKIEYQRSAGDPWQLVALVDGAAGSYAWTCPDDSTSDARIRVSDAWDASPLDESGAPFRIRVSRLALNRSVWDFGGVALGLQGHYPLQVTNFGDGPLDLVSIASADPRFWPGRSALTLAAGASDTVGLWYEPDGEGFHAGDVLFVSTTEAAVVSLAGHGVGAAAVEGGTPLAFALEPNRPNPFTGRTLIRYALPGRVHVALDVYDLQGHRVARLVDGEQGPGTFAIPFGDGAGLRPLAAGVYFTRLEAGAFRASRKMLMLR